MSKNCAVILAAGEGKRMKANKPKPMMEAPTANSSSTTAESAPPSAGRESASAPVTPS